MSHVRIRHEAKSGGIVVGTSTSGSTTFRMDGAAGGMVYVSGVTDTHTLTAYGSSDGTTFRQLYGVDGQPATIAVGAAGGVYPLPDATYPLRLAKLVSGTELGTAAAVVLTMKS
jgi:hypothetical protein